MKSGIELITAECEKRDLDTARDDEYVQMELVSAALAYLFFNLFGGDYPRKYWPRDFGPFHAGELRHNLARAGAFCATEIDRLNRQYEQF